LDFVKFDIFPHLGVKLGLLMHTSLWGCLLQQNLRNFVRARYTLEEKIDEPEMQQQTKDIGRRDDERKYKDPIKMKKRHTITQHTMAR